jgi:hypothetical protein
MCTFLISHLYVTFPAYLKIRLVIIIIIIITINFMELSPSEPDSSSTS